MPHGAIASTKIPFWALVLLTILAIGGSAGRSGVVNAQNPNGISKAVVEQMVAAINDLVQRLGQRLGEQPSALTSKTEIFSPVSIGSMMFLLLRAASKDTRNELLDVMQLGQLRKTNNSVIAKNFDSLLKDFTHDIAGKGILDQLPEWHSSPLSGSCYHGAVDYEEDYDDKYLDEPIAPNAVKLANGIFLQDGLVNKSILERLSEELYQARIEQVNFKQQPALARATINRWVNESTRGLIEEILTQDPDTATQMVIANALYFKATWKTFFNEPQYTRQKPFFPDGEDRPPVLIPTMFADGCFPYYSSPELNASIMAFPYRNKTTSMYIILPNESNRTKVRQLQAKLTSAELDRLIGEMRWKKAAVQFPRMQASNTYDLRQQLQQLGLKRLFDSTKNSLKIASMSGKMSKRRKLYASAMLHKIDLKVNERGTEGGAVTITMSDRSLSPVIFRVRGPFLIAIRHDPTKMLLFYGAVYDPS